MEKNRKPKVSIYIPVYGVEKYIEKCVRSLFEQTLEDIEYIFVNDCTPDNSINILKQVLEEYPNRKSQVTIINHDINKGVCQARLTGIQYVNGEYVACCEPDDWIEKNMYEELYKKAKETNADMVSCDHYIESANGTEYGVSHYNGTFDGLMKSWIKREYLSYIWSRIIKRELFEKNPIYYPVDKKEGSYGEDCVLMCQLLYYTQTYVFVPKAFYHYRIVLNSISHNQSNINKRRLSLVNKYMWIFDFLSEKYGDKYSQEILYVKLFLKLGWCKNGISDDFYTIWSESNQDRVLRNLHLCISKKIMFWLAIHRKRRLFNALVRIYNLIKKNK